jgi:hypothetical protein
MAPAQAALHSVEPHVHPVIETCPTCEQPIPNEKAEEIRARAAVAEQRLVDAANARAAQQIANEKAQIEAASKAKVEEANREKNEAVQKATMEAVAKIEAARVAGQKFGRGQLRGPSCSRRTGED